MPLGSEAGPSRRFIGLDDLIATKRTGRLQDAADIEVLEEIKRAAAAGLK